MKKMEVSNCVTVKIYGSRRQTKIVFKALDSKFSQKIVMDTLGDPVNELGMRKRILHIRLPKPEEKKKEKKKVLSDDDRKRSLDLEQIFRQANEA